MLEALLENEQYQFLGAIAFVLASAFAFYKGMYAKRNTPTDISHIVLAKFQLIHEEIERVSIDTRRLKSVQFELHELKNHLHEVEETLSVMMETSRMTFDKVDGVQTNVEILKDRDRK